MRVCLEKVTHNSSQHLLVHVYIELSVSQHLLVSRTISQPTYTSIYRTISQPTFTSK